MTTLYFVLFLVAIGYPAGLKGEAIPLEARIMAMADVFDALVSKQVYKELVPPAHRRGSALGSPFGRAGGDQPPERVTSPRCPLSQLR